MRDKTEQIIQAAAKVFIRKGLQATTYELATAADVAEVTLFRKFGNKQKLFVTVVKTVLEKQFYTKLMKEAKTSDTDEFLRAVISNRLEVLSKNRDLVKMLLSESLMGQLPADIDVPEMIFNSLVSVIEHHADQNSLDIDAKHWARLLSGIFLSHLVLKSVKPYSELGTEEKADLLEKYVASFKGLR